MLIVDSIEIYITLYKFYIMLHSCNTNSLLIIKEVRYKQSDIIVLKLFLCVYKNKIIN